MRSNYGTFASMLLFSVAAFGQEPVATQRPVPLTRPEMKKLLEDMKSRELRIPLPELSDEERVELGERADSYESRLRYHYMPPNEPSGYGFGRSRSPIQSSGSNGSTASAASAATRDYTRNADANMSLSYAFKTQLFWIVSRTNNCQYCLGHQEQKLSAVGLTDDQIAALDGDWSRHPEAARAAFAYARKLTYEPHLIGDTDIENLRSHYTDLQILEMTMSVAGNNAINRWKEGTGVPQSKTGDNFFRRAENVPTDRPLPIETFLTPTSPEYETAFSQVVAVRRDPLTGKPTSVAVSTRPPVETPDQVAAALAAARERTARLPVLSDDEARAALGDDAPAGPLPAWLRLLANFPNDARGRIQAIRLLESEGGDLTPLLKAQVSWIIAREDRAWYATGLLQQRLRDLGQTDEQIFALDGRWDEFTPAERALFRFAKQLAATPIALTDAEVAQALRLTSPRHVIQLINFVTSRAYFDRVTEAAGLPLDS